MAINLSTTILSEGVSKAAPGIDGNGLYGTVAVWADAASGGTVLMGYSQLSYAPQILNPQWTAYDSPAVAIAPDWGTLFMAFTGYDGYVHLGSSADGWTELTLIAGPSGNITAGQAGPGLAYSEGVLYIAWQTSEGQLSFATMAKGGPISYSQTNVPLSSRPTICAEDPSRIYVLCGGPFAEGRPGPLTIYLSLDGGQSFSQVATPATMCYGPPSLAILDQFYLAWADQQGSLLCLAQTTDLGSFTPMNYGVPCHEGGPALIPMLTFPNFNDPDDIIFSLSSGWSVGSSDPTTNHHVAMGSFGPLQIAGAQVTRQQRQIEQLRAPRAPEPCPDPSTIYDPATGKCVSKVGCWGQCVLSSFSTWGFFNPISYAICVASCKSAQ